MPMPMPPNGYNGTIYSMQMTLSTSGTVSNFLINGWGALNTDVFIVLLLLTMGIVVLTNFVGLMLQKVEAAKGEG